MLEQSDGVLLLTQFLNLGGLERMVSQLAATLKSESKMRPHVFVYDRIEGKAVLDESISKSGIRVYRVQKGQGFSLKLVFEILKYCRKNRIHTIHSHDLGPMIYGSLAKMASLGKIRLIHTQHSLLHLSAKKASYYEKFCFPQIDRFCVVSPDLYSHYERTAIHSRLELVPNGVNFAEVQTSENKVRLRKKLCPEVKPELIWLLCMARIHPGKGQTHALRVWGALSPEFRAKSALIFIGSDTRTRELENMREWISHAPDSAQIHYAGETLDPLSWISASDVFVSGSEFEGLPLAPLESLGSGIPCLLSDIPGHRALSNENQSVKFFPLSEPDKGARLLEALIEKSKDRDFQTELLLHAHEIQATFSIKTMAETYRKIYDRSSLQR